MYEVYCRLVPINGDIQSDVLSGIKAISMNVDIYHKPKFQGARDGEYASLTGYDHSLIRTLILEREKRNLEARLLKIEKDRQKIINSVAQRKEKTWLDLCERVRKRSTSLEKLSQSEGETESIKISRRESLNMLRINNDRRPVNAARLAFNRPFMKNVNRNKLNKKPSEEEENPEVKQTETLNSTRKRERRYSIQMRLSTPKSSKTEPLLPRITTLRLPISHLKRPSTWKDKAYNRHFEFKKKVT